MRGSNAVTIGAAILVSTLALSATRPLADSRVADLLQAGKIRLALFLPLYVKDAVTGELRGATTGIVSIDLMRAFAARLGVEVQLAGYSTPPEVVACLKNSTCDVGIMGVTPGRAAEVDLSPPIPAIRLYLSRASRLFYPQPGRRGPTTDSHCGRAQPCVDVGAEPPVQECRTGRGRYTGRRFRSATGRTRIRIRISPRNAAGLCTRPARRTGAGRAVWGQPAGDGGPEGPRRTAYRTQRVRRRGKKLRLGGALDRARGLGARHAGGTSAQVRLNAIACSALDGQLNQRAEYCGDYARDHDQRSDRQRYSASHIVDTDRGSRRGDPIAMCFVAVHESAVPH